MRIATSCGIFMPHFAIVVTLADDNAFGSYDCSATAQPCSAIAQPPFLDVKRANSPATKVANSPQPKGCNSPTHLLPLQFFDYCLTAPTTAHAGGMAAISRGLFPAGNNS